MAMQAKTRRRIGVTLVAGLIVAPLAACSSDDGGSGKSGGTVTLGYFPNLTHGSAIVADQKASSRTPCRPTAPPSRPSSSTPGATPSTRS